MGAGGIAGEDAAPGARVSSGGEEAPGAVLEWRAWPAAERPAQAVALAVALGAGALALGACAGAPLVGGASFAILFLSLSAYFLPTRYRLDEEGVEVRSALGGLRRRRWAALRTYAADRRGVTLSPYRRRTWLEPYRGVRLLYYEGGAGGGAEERVLARVAARLGPQPPRGA